MVAPAIFTPPLRHWKVGAGLPDAETVKDAGVPVQAEAFEGFVVIAGAVLTVRLAAVLVAVEQVLVATQS